MTHAQYLHLAHEVHTILRLASVACFASVTGALWTLWFFIVGHR